VAVANFPVATMQVAGGDAAAGPGRPERGSEHPLVLFRPYTLAIVFRHFMERRRHPELILNCLFQVWRCLRSSAGWKTNIKTDLSVKDVEAAVLPVSDSRTSAASFACLETLGVSPPPALGWVPRPDKDAEKISPSSSPERSPHAEWWANPGSREWIYHSSEDMYFHLPTSSLWEKRDMDCCDPMATQHTFFRVDAVHLQALSHFARSVDSAVVPMAWQAWVRYTRKRRGGSTTNPVSSPAGKGPNSRQPSKGRDSTEKKEKRGQRFQGLDSSKPNSPEGKFRSPAGEEEGAAQSDARKSAVVQSEVAAANEVAAQGGAAAADANATTATANTTGAATVEPQVTPIMVTKPAVEDNIDTARRGCCLCMRSRKRKVEYSKTAPNAPTSASSTEESAKSKNGGQQANGTGNAGNAQVGWAVNDEKRRGNDSMSISPEANKPAMDTADRHQKRFEQFMAEVKRNPQRLVNHVERRRAEKTQLTFVVV